MYIAGDPNFEFLFSNLGWWPKYILFPFLLALLISYRLRFVHITISDSDNLSDTYKLVLHKLNKGPIKFLVLSEDIDKCHFITEKITISGRVLGTDKVKVSLRNGKIEIVGRLKHLTGLLINVP